MPALLPLLLLGSHMAIAHVVSVADPVPQLDIGPSCRSAAATAMMGARDSSACERDENDARGKLEQEWNQFTPSEQERCVQLSKVGGSPSYVELLTCLEMATAAKSRPADATLKGGAGMSK